MPENRSVRPQPAGAGDDYEVRKGAFEDGRAKNAPRQEARKSQVVERLEDWPVLERAAATAAESAAGPASTAKA